VNSLPGTVPFGFTFDHQGFLLVTEAGPSALASFELHGNGTVSPLDQVATARAAACWIVEAEGRFYVSDAGSAVLSGFATSPSGQLLAKFGDSPTSPGPVDAAADGRFVYVQTGAEGLIDELEVQPDGSLATLGSVRVPDAAGGEGIAIG
jgi:hypothetical protein